MGHRRMLAIGLVGTGLYAGVLGAGAGAQSPAPSVTPEPSPEPTPTAPTPAEAAAVDAAPVEASPPDAAPADPPSAPAAPEPAAGSQPGPEAQEPARPEPARPEAAAPTAAASPAGDGPTGGPAPTAEAPAADGAPPSRLKAAADSSFAAVERATATGRDGGRRSGRKARGSQRAEKKPNLTIRAGCLTAAAGDPCTRPQRTQRPPAEPPAAAPAPLPAPGAPTAISNPSFTLIGPIGPAIDAPDFFIEQFRVPPVLLPIYRAAARRYGIRWEILAAINEIETNYGRNVAVSSAGALGWMQFMPSTWETYGVDGNRDGVKDPYHPVDAIFAAANYLRAAGAAQDLPGAIFAYNHADWYVDSVLMRARLIAALPSDMMGSLTGLASGRFPVRGGATYGAAIGRDRGRRVALRMFARAGAPVVAVNDGTIVRTGHTSRLGRFIELRDGQGNTYVYARLAAANASGNGDGLQRLRPGKRIASGRILGRIGRTAGGRARRLRFEIRPAGRGVPRLGTASIVDGWNLLRPGVSHPTLGMDALATLKAGDASLARILSMSGAALAARVLSDERVQIRGCGREDIRAGLIDGRVLAALEYLAASGLNPTVSSLRCGHSLFTASGNVSEHSTGSAVDIAAINGVPVLGNQGSGSITELAVRRLLTLQGAMKPHQIITLMQFQGTDNTFAMADHADHIHVGWRPQPGAGAVLDPVRFPTP